VDNTGVLRVSVREGSPAEQAALVNAVALAYLELAISQEQKPRQERLQELRKLRDAHEDTLQHKRQVLNKVTQERGEGARSTRQQFEREDLAVLRREQQRVHLARIRAQARLNYQKQKVVGEAARAALANLEEEVGVLAEQEKLLQAEIVPLSERAQALARDEAVGRTEFALLREEISRAEEIGRRIAEQVEVLQVESRAGPRVRLLQKAEVPRPGK
jgi:hypothetical protein